LQPRQRLCSLLLLLCLISSLLDEFLLLLEPPLLTQLCFGCLILWRRGWPPCRQLLLLWVLQQLLHCVQVFLCCSLHALGCQDLLALLRRLGDDTVAGTAEAAAVAAAYTCACTSTIAA
jgi:hypothetical protein